MAAEERPVREVAFNRKARRNYEIQDRLEVGIALEGTEVKSLRAGRVSLDEAYVRTRGEELWLEGAHIAEYEQGNVHNHEPTRSRRLLAHKREVRRWRQRSRERGLTMVPLRVFFRGKWAKVEVGLGKGRKLHDKRKVIQEREAARALRGTRGRRP